MLFSEKVGTTIGAALGTLTAGFVVGEGVHLFGFAASWIYLAGVISALLGAVIGGAVGSWACSTSWESSKERLEYQEAQESNATATAQIADKNANARLNLSTHP